MGVCVCVCVCVCARARGSGSAVCIERDARVSVGEGDRPGTCTGDALARECGRGARLGAIPVAVRRVGIWKGDAARL